MDRFDAILQRVGAFGKWQRFQFVILSPSAVFLAWQNFLYIFIAYIPRGICHQNANGSDSNEKACELSCKNETFHSAVYDWPFLCHNNAGRASIQSVYFIGYIFGTIVFYSAVKKFGRKRVALFCTLLTALCGSMAPYSYFYLIFNGFRFFTGLFAAGLQLSLWFLSLEMTGSRCHPMVLCLWRLADSVGYVSLAGIVASTFDWHYAYVACSLCILILLAYTCLIPESARWLLIKGRKADTERILRKIAISNGHILRHESVRLKSGEIYSYRQYTRKHVTQDPKMLMWSIILIIVWVLCEFAYYVLSLIIPRIDSHSYPFIPHTVAGMAEIPALILAMICLKHVPRKRLAYFGGVFSILFSFICSFVPSAHTIGLIAISAVAKFGLVLLYISLQILTLEMYPNELRPVAFFTFVALSKFGSILAPYCETTIDSYIFFPFVSSGVSCLLATILTIFLPETLGAGDNRPSSTEETTQTMEVTEQEGNDEIDFETNIENELDANAQRIEMQDMKTNIEVA